MCKRPRFTNRKAEQLLLDFHSSRHARRRRQGRHWPGWQVFLTLAGLVSLRRARDHLVELFASVGLNVRQARCHALQAVRIDLGRLGKAADKTHGLNKIVVDILVDQRMQRPGQ